MIYIVGLITGVLNGLFASGAGQILVFYLIYIIKQETHISRAASVSVLSISSIFALFGYSKIVDFEITKIIILVIVSIIGGVIGSKIMKKIPADILNIVSGVIIISLTVYRFFSNGGSL